MGGRGRGLAGVTCGTNSPASSTAIRISVELMVPELSTSLSRYIFCRRKTRKSQQPSSGATGGRGEEPKTHQVVLDLGPQHLELHQAQFVAAVFLWHQFRSCLANTAPPPPPQPVVTALALTVHHIKSYMGRPTGQRSPVPLEWT